MRHFTIGLAALLAATFTINASAQSPRIPEASPTQTIIQDFGLGKITITYSRPSVKGRTIFGGINPWGQVWRTGANAATTITFSENVIIEGHSVPAGTYWAPAQGSVTVNSPPTSTQTGVGILPYNCTVSYNTTDANSVVTGRVEHCV